MTFVMKLFDFVNKIIVDTRYLIKNDGGPNTNYSKEKLIEYRLDYIGDLLENTEGMFSTIATITNFMM